MIVRSMCSVYFMNQDFHPLVTAQLLNSNVRLLRKVCMVTYTTLTNGICSFCPVTMLANEKAADKLQYTLHNVFGYTCAIGGVDFETFFISNSNILRQLCLWIGRPEQALKTFFRPHNLLGNAPEKFHYTVVKVQ
jgi:hypothetical protein